MRCCEFHRRHAVLTTFIFLIFIGSTFSALISNGFDGEEANRVFSSGTEINSPPTKAPLKAEMDLKSTLDEFSCDPGGKFNFTFDIEELNGCGLTIDNARFMFYSFDLSINYYTQEFSDLDIFIAGGTRSTEAIVINVSEEMVNQTARNGDDGIRFKMDIYGSDDNGNPISGLIWSEFTIKMNVAVLVSSFLGSNVHTALDRYYQDVLEDNSVNFIEITSHWPTPESVREELTSLWEDQNITGAILVGDLPYAMWELNHSDGSKEPCPIPIFYEDLDGDFADNDSNGLYDLHYWGENDGPEIWVSFLSPPSETIPSTNLRTGGTGSPSGLNGIYHNTNYLVNPVLTRNDKEIEFYWEDRDPPAPVPDDSFSIKWEGQVKSDIDETITFEVIHGGGMVLTIDGDELLRDDSCPPWHKKTTSAEVFLSAGWHDIELIYMENGWGDNKGAIRLCWRSNSSVSRSIVEWFDKDHSYYTGELGAPERGLLFMDYAYGNQSKMLDPIREKHMEPLFGNNLHVGGGQNTTNATEYLNFLDMGHELTSIWTHSGGGGHQFGVPEDSGAEFTAAQSHQTKETNGSLVTLIWGCHAGDFADSGGTGSVSKTRNLVVNYAFNTNYGLAAMGCTRSYGTTFNTVYHDLKEGSYLALGYFHYKEEGYDKERRMAEPHTIGEKMWIEDEVMFGDPFLRINHFPENKQLEIENGSRFASGDTVSVSIDSEGATEMQFFFDLHYTNWMPYNRTTILEIPPGEGVTEIMVQTRNSYGWAPMYSTDKIYIENDPPTIESFTINGGMETTENRSVILDMILIDAISGLDAMCFSNNGTLWTDWEEAAFSREWVIEEGEGKKTVHIKVCDNAGNIATRSTSINFDSRGPVVYSEISGNNGYNGWYFSEVELDLISMADDLHSIRYRIDENDWDMYYDTILITSDGSHEFQFYGIDLLGNMGPMESVTIKIDRTAPENVSFIANNNEDRTNETLVHLQIEGYDVTSGIDKMSFRIDHLEWSPWIDFDTSYILDIGNGDGAKELRMRARDHAGNVLETPNPVSITLDTLGPSLIHTSPVNGQIVSSSKLVTMEFNEELDPSSIHVSIIDLYGNEIGYELFVKSQGVIEIKPELEEYMKCIITVYGNLSDTSGNRMGEDTSIFFYVKGYPSGNPEDLWLEVNGTDVLLTWNAPFDVGDIPIEFYSIQRSGGGASWAEIGTTSNGFYLDTDVVPETLYKYRISAFNGHEYSDPSYEMSITVLEKIVNDDDDDLDDDDTSEETNDKKSISPPLLIVITAITAILILAGAFFLLRKKKEEFWEE